MSTDSACPPEPFSTALGAFSIDAWGCTVIRPHFNEDGLMAHKESILGKVIPIPEQVQPI
jgi:hypothetical protein